MKGLYNTFKTNEQFETEGVWLEYGYLDDDESKPIRIKIARAGGQNKAFTKALEKATKPHRKALQAGMLDDRIADRLYKGVFAETVVLDWMNVTDQDGNELEFTKDNVLKVFSDLPDLFVDLREQAGNVSLFRDEVREADLGNSGKSLSTDSSKDRSKGK